MSSSSMTPPGTTLLAIVLSAIAGSVDVISFLGLGGLFAAHITGNLVILAAHVVTDGAAPLAPMLSVPVFMVALALTRLLVVGLESIGVASLRPLLLLELLLIAGSLVLCVALGPRVDPNTATAIIAGMLGVSAMAVQNGLVQLALTGMPSTTAMTSNVTGFTMDVSTMLLGRGPDDVTRARTRAKQTWPALAGFALGCGLGAACELVVDLWSLALPVGLALLAAVMGFLQSLRERR
jgi:uncharacterized membrane protein YoaK (UPF0700 family)